MAWLWRLLGLLVILLVACTSPRANESPLPVPGVPESPIATPRATVSPPLALQEGMAAIRGEIGVQSLSWTGMELYVYACPFSGTEEEGFFVLEPSVHPSTTVSPEGIFQLVNVPAGAYVLVVGPSPEEAIPFREADRTGIFYVESGQLLELGKVSLK